MPKRTLFPVYLCLLAIGLLGMGQSIAAQPTNVAVYQRMAVSQLGAVPDTVGTFTLHAPLQMPYLRTALTQHWQQAGHMVFLFDSTSASPYPVLRYAVEEAQVRYQRLPKPDLSRAVTLALRHSLTAPNGRLISEARHREVYADTVRFADWARLQPDPFPEAQAPRPPDAGLRRYLEPAVLATAIGTLTYLFFAIRS